VISAGWIVDDIGEEDLRVIRDYIEMLHPERAITFLRSQVLIDNRKKFNGY